MSEWQPIETAPRDETKFVMLDAVSATASVGHWMNDVEWINKDKKPGEWLARPSWFPLFNPTHWMPLPPPPIG